MPYAVELIQNATYNASKTFGNVYRTKQFLGEFLNNEKISLMYMYVNLSIRIQFWDNFFKSIVDSEIEIVDTIIQWKNASFLKDFLVNTNEL